MSFRGVIKELGVFLIGIIVAVLAERLIQEEVATTEIGLTIIYIIFGGLVLILVNHSIKHFKKLTEKLEISADYFEEDIFRGKPYNGDIYKELERNVRLAKKEIIGLDFTISESNPSQIFKEKSNKHRHAYLEAIEKKVSTVKGFRYVRIHQIDDLSRTPDTYIKGLTFDHCIRLLTCEACKSRNAEVSIMKARIKRLQSFLLIDQKTLLVEFDGTAEDGGVYPFSVLKLEDKGDKIIKPIIRVINDVVSSGVPIHQELLHTSKNSEKL
jgi:hypothetical protein